MTNPYWQRQHQRYMTGGGVAARYPKQEKNMTDEREDMWVRAATQLQAARKMLAALKKCRDIACNAQPDPDDIEGRLDQVIDVLHEIIPVAEAAGITTGEGLPK